MTHRKPRRRWSLIPAVISFEAIDLELTQEEIMADLRSGWSDRREPSDRPRSADRAAA